MLVRLVLGLVAWGLMMVPRPNPSPKDFPSTTGPDDQLPPTDVPDVPELPDTPHTPVPLPDPGFPKSPPTTRHRPHYPSVPPTPPPGYDGDWPPRSERPDIPPTAPPGYEGTWPPTSKPSIRERLRDLWRQIQELLDESGPRVRADNAENGVKLLAGAADQAATDASGSTEA